MKEECTTKTILTEDRICITLQEKLYSMADNESQTDYEPLHLKWTLPINSVGGLISVLENVIYLLGYVQKNKCNKECIDKIIQNDIQPILNGLKNELDFALACVILLICKEKRISPMKKI